MLGELLHRTLALLRLGFWPAIAPFDVGPAAAHLDPNTIGIDGAILAGLTCLSVLVASRSFVAAAIGAGTIGVALISALAMGPDDAPLARALYMEPLVWTSIASFVYCFARWVNRRPAGLDLRAPFLGTLLGFGVIFPAWGDLHTRIAMLERSLREDPGNDSSALTLWRLRTLDNEKEKARQAVASCAAASPPGCLCVGHEVADLITERRVQEARSLADRARNHCDGLHAAWAEVLAADNDPGALAEVDVALKDDPKNVQALMARAIALWRKRDLDHALLAAQEAINDDGGMPARRLTGLIAFDQGDDERALGELRTVLTRDGDDFDALYVAGRAAHRAKHFSEAQRRYEHLLELQPDNPDVHYWFAILGRDVNAPDVTRVHYERLAAYAPMDPRLPELKKLVGGK